MPNIVGIGIDAVDLDTFERARFKDRVAEFFLTKTEREQMPGGAELTQHLASRWALKEAVIKAFPERIGPLEFEILRGGRGPEVRFLSQDRNRMFSICSSITHSTLIAAAFAVVQKRS